MTLGLLTVTDPEYSGVNEKALDLSLVKQFERERLRADEAAPRWWGPASLLLPIPGMLPSSAWSRITPHHHAHSSP